MSRAYTSVMSKWITQNHNQNQRQHHDTRSRATRHYPPILLFITKPFDKSELLALMQAISRRSKGFSQPTLRLGGIELNLDSREVTVDGQEVHLTGKEYSILELLVLRKGMVLTKEAFLNHLYGGMDEPEMKIIDF